MQGHLAYPLLLPLFACIAMGYSPELVGALLYGWLPWLIYALMVGTPDAISMHPLRMAAIVLAVPSTRVWVGGRAAPAPLLRCDGGCIGRLLARGSDEAFIGRPGGGRQK